MRISHTLVLLLLGLLAAPAPARAAELWYAQTLQTGAAGAQMTHFWAKDKRLRVEAVFRGHRIVTLVTGERYYAYDLLLGRGVSVRRSPRAVQEDKIRKRPFGNEGERLIAKGAEPVRSENAGGRQCQVYRLTDGAGRREVCLSTDEGRFPLWAEFHSRQTGNKTRTTYLTWFQPEEIPDRMFQPEAFVQIQSFEYEQYLEQLSKGPVGPVPVLYEDLLHGRRER